MMKAWLQEGNGTADVLRLREVERPLLTDEGVLVKVRAASVNAADYHMIHGGFIVTLMGKLLRMPPAPPIRGSDVAGIVEAVGPNVTSLRAGDEVFGTARGSWAEYTIGAERGLVLKPAGVSFTEAGAIGVAALTALQGLRDKGELVAGQRVLVYGAGGGVGTYAVQIAKALGAHVTAVTSTKNAELVRPLGADVLVDYTKEDIAKRRERYDVIYDVAAIRSIRSLKRMLAPGGILVCAGAPKHGGMSAVAARIIAVLFRARILKQRVSFYTAAVSPEDLRFLKELVETGKVRPAIDRTFPFGETREAVRYAEKGQARAKVVITVD